MPPELSHLGVLFALALAEIRRERFAISEDL
jgi:hypothetical protein